ncbi:UNVERIFIED_CONTAM: Sucrose synthase [Sesamum calycinum]|uniref:Sucrose synthase n=2 Tax=Sesamum TaxID=4181 RepID=A0AAW2WIJ3_SESRA
MTCGLPTFATCRGGPLEIIQDGISGFHVSCGQGFCPHGRFLSKNAVKIIQISGSIYPKEVGLQRIQEGKADDIILLLETPPEAGEA